MDVNSLKTGELLTLASRPGGRGDPAVLDRLADLVFRAAAETFIDERLVQRDELVGIAFERLLSCLGKYDPNKDPDGMGFVVGIVRYVAREEVRRRIKELNRQCSLEAIGQQEAEEFSCRNAEIPDLEKLEDNLAKFMVLDKIANPRQKMMLAMTKKGMERCAIAKELGVEPNTVDVWISRLRKVALTMKPELQD